MTVPSPLVHLRPPSGDDARSIAALLGELGYPSTAEEVRARLATFDSLADASIAVALVQSEVVGLVTAHVLSSIHANESMALLTTIVVAAPHHGCGVGTALLTHAETWARGKGAVRMSLTSGVHRDGAHGFYERRGYARTGVRLTKTL